YGILHYECLESVLIGVQGGGLDAVIGGQSRHIEVRDFFFFQESGKIRIGGLKSRVSIVLVLGALQEYFFQLGDVQFRVKIRSLRFLDAMRRPLFEVNAVLGMPILGGDDQWKKIHQLIDDGNDLVPLGNRQGPTGAKIILNIDDQECFHNDLKANHVDG